VSINDPHDIYSFRKHQPTDPLEDVPLSKDWEEETFEGKPLVQRQFMEEDQGTKIDPSAKEAWELYHDCYREKTRLYDGYVGRILNTLDQQGLRKNTVVIITSDHGDMDTHHRLIFKGPFLDEHMVRVPLMIRMPDAFEKGVPRRVRDVDVVNVDLVPTLREICGLPAAETHGRSLLPLLTEDGLYTPREYVVTQYYGKQQWVNPIRMIRTETYKLNRHLHRDDELYDLRNDPDEMKNLAGDPGYADVVSTLGKRLDQWMKDHNDPFYNFTLTDREGNPLYEKSHAT
jgi:arylsulfatase A-like enzyme